MRRDSFLLEQLLPLKVKPFSYYLKIPPRYNPSAYKLTLTLLHSEGPKLFGVLALLSAIELSLNISSYL